MTLHASHPVPRIARRAPGPDGEQIITLAALAVGGHGGGVLTNWIVEVAEANGWHAQSTSVAGVAQRTSATIYDVEMCLDTAVMRGFVTPGRTTLIASAHRIAAVSEKIVPGDGRGDGAAVIRWVEAITSRPSNPRRWPRNAARSFPPRCWCAGRLGRAALCARQL